MTQNRSPTPRDVPPGNATPVPPFRHLRPQDFLQTDCPRAMSTVVITLGVDNGSTHIPVRIGRWMRPHFVLPLYTQKAGHCQDHTPVQTESPSLGMV
ncbi:MAG: hypothetical protein CM1200mP25_2900 [Acidobacteriota bacterium]|nr:MAG: hypothetical protein CM1200mP25_2900 [Acidobacteriota bacterium]